MKRFLTKLMEVLRSRDSSGSCDVVGLQSLEATDSFRCGYIFPKV